MRLNHRVTILGKFDVQTDIVRYQCVAPSFSKTILLIEILPRKNNLSTMNAENGLERVPVWLDVDTGNDVC